MLSSLIYAVITTSLVATVLHLHRGGKIFQEVTRRGETKRKFAWWNRVESGWVFAAIVGVLIGGIHYFVYNPLRSAKKGDIIIYFAPVAAAIIIVIMVWGIVDWKRKAVPSEHVFLALWPFLAIEVMAFLILKDACSATTALWSSPFWTSVVRGFLPWAALILALSHPIMMALFYTARADGEYADDPDVPDEEANEAAKRSADYHNGGVAVAAIAGLAMLLLAILAIKWSFGGESRTVAAATSSTAATSTRAAVSSTTTVATTTMAAVQATTEAEEEDWYFFLNTVLLEDKDESNDFNFGKNPYNKEWKAADYNRDFRERLALDPALLAGDSAWLDAIVGTRYLGTFYEECKGEWASTINTAKRAFMEDQLLYYKTLDAFFLFLDSAESVELKQGLDMDDQMYMNPFTVDGVPDLIVMETRDHEGWFLVYTFVIKGQKFEVAYRIDCGYQPTNVEEVMDIKPQPEPERPAPTPTTPVPTTPAPTTPAPTTTVPPTTPAPTTVPPTTPAPTTTVPPTTPAPTTTVPPTTPAPTTVPPTTPVPTEPSTEPQYTKDPSKGMNPTEEEKVRPNDDKGPGPNTNQTDPAADQSKSAADTPTNSSSYSSYEEYKKQMEEKKKTNESQKTGKDNNTPTPTTAAPTTAAPTTAAPTTAQPTTAKPTEPATTAPTTTVNVDNNGDTGNGGAPINVPTPTEPPVNHTDPASPTTGPITTQPGQPWGGPPD